MKQLFSIILFSFTMSTFAQSYVNIGPSATNTSITLLTPNHIVPYNNYNNSGHVQYVYTAAEMLSNGATGATYIDSLGWNIVTQITSPLPDYTIKLKNTTAADVTNYDSTGLQTVYNIHTVTPNSVVGWRMFAFDSLFYWDGSSNILVDVCWNKIGTTSSTGSIYHFGTNGVTNERLYIKSQTLDMCGATPNTHATFKPFIRFSICADATVCNITTSLAKNALNNQSPYYNQERDVLTFPNTASLNEIQLYDLVGRRNTGKLSNHQIDCSSLQPGMYVFAFEGKTIKFMKL